jgi:hypothetical protein
MDCSTFSFDLHVLGTPPALILSQDQTLVWNLKFVRNEQMRSCISPCDPQWARLSSTWHLAVSTWPDDQMLIAKCQMLNHRAHRGAQRKRKNSLRALTEVWALANFVRSLGFSPEPFHLTTGTFNLVVKDRTALRLSGAYSVRAGTLTRTRPSSKPVQVTGCARLLSTRCAHRIST